MENEKAVYISDRGVEFRPHNSLKDSPVLFETSFAKGCIFYLSHGGGLGGDAFTIRADDSLTVALIEDVAGHGTIGRTRITPFFSKLDQISERLSTPKLDDTGIINDIIELNQETGPRCAIALSLVRILPNGTTNYLSLGENGIFIRKSGLIYTPERGMKIGWHEVKKYSREDLANLFYAGTDTLQAKDRILICSDGIIESEFFDIEKRTKKIKNILKRSPTLENCIRQINKTTEYDLNNETFDHSTIVPDDYTIVALEMKDK